jgi:hypothetical protein
MAALQSRSACSLSALGAMIVLASNALGEGGESVNDAVAINSLPFTDTGDTCDNIDDYDEACPYTGSDAPDVVYAFTPGSDMLVSINLCASGYDTKVFVYENEVTAGEPFACNDDNNAVCGPGYRSFLPDDDDPAVWLITGNTYFIVIDGWDGACGTYELALEEVAPGACCLPDGSCAILDSETCASLGGAFQGENTSCACIGDIDGDGDVDTDDLLLLFAAWGSADPDADLDDDGDVGVGDLLLLLAGWDCEAADCASCVDCDDTEGEPICGPNYVDDYNSGCGFDPIIFQPIACGETICGGSGTYQFDGSNYRDTDWFDYVATIPILYTWEVTATFPLLIFVFEPPCPGTILGSAVVPPCAEASITTDCLDPGTYWFWVGPSVFTGVPCETARYVAELDCVTCDR